MWTFLKKWFAYISDGLTRQAVEEVFFWFASNYILAPAGLVTSTNTVKTGASPTIVMINGQNVIVAASSSFPALTGLNLATGQTGCALFGVDAAGNLYTWISPVVIASATNLVGLVWPVPGDNIPVVLLGGVIIQDVSAGAFTGGTTSLATAGLTVTYFNASVGEATLPPVTFR